MAVSLWPPARSGLLGLVVWLLSAIPNESPFLAFYWIAASTLLAYSQGQLRDAGMWAALALAAAPLAAAPVLVRRSLRAAPTLEQALGRPIPRRPPWARVLFAPLPLFHPGVRRIANLSYGEAGRRNRLDLYKRRSGGSGGPVLIHLHGGGFSFLPGRRSFYARRLLFRLAREGWVCISATYRLQPAAKFPDELVDVKKVIAWARAQAAEHGGDPARIVLAGSSFGARLATLAGFTVNEPAFQPGFERVDTSVAAVVGLYGYYGSIASRRALPSSPFDYADRSSAPLLIVHGDQDTFTPPSQARALAERARRASANPVVYVELPGAQHSFDLLSSIRIEAVIDGIEAFVQSVAAPDATIAHAAQDLATLVCALQQVSPRQAPAGRGIPLAQRAKEFRFWLERFEGDSRVAAEWKRALAAPPWDGPPVWHHGDLDVRNWLVRNGRIRGVIDWGSMGVGDPACDVMVAWKLHLPAARDAFREALPTDDATWERARGWVLSQAVAILAYYTPENNPILYREAERWLDAVLLERT